MPNKIKDIFSDDMFNIGGHLRFRDDEAYKNFLAALEIAQVEGRVVPVEGVTSIATEVRHQGTKFPLEEHTAVSNFMVGPAMEPVKIPFKVGTIEKAITLFRSQTTENVILASEPNSIVSFRFILPKNSKTHTVNYKVQFEHAKNLEDIIDSFSSSAALLATLYRQDENRPAEEGKVSLVNVKKYFRYSEAFFKRLLAVEHELGLSISTDKLKNLSAEDQHDVDELYLLLCKKQTLRLNAKLTATESTAITAPRINENLSVGDKIKLTFLGTIEYTLFDKTISLHTANLILNAVVKEIQETAGDTVKILYGDSDSKPMYIAFTAYKTSYEAEQEADDILKHEEVYTNALTSNESIQQFYSAE